MKTMKNFDILSNRFTICYKLKSTKKVIIWTVIWVTLLSCIF